MSSTKLRWNMKKHIQGKESCISSYRKRLCLQLSTEILSTRAVKVWTDDFCPQKLVFIPIHPHSAKNHRKVNISVAIVCLLCNTLLPQRKPKNVLFTPWVVCLLWRWGSWRKREIIASSFMYERRTEKIWASLFHMYQTSNFGSHS